MKKLTFLLPVFILFASTPDSFALPSGVAKFKTRQDSNVRSQSSVKPGKLFKLLFQEQDRDRRSKTAATRQNVQQGEEFSLKNLGRALFGGNRAKTQVVRTTAYTHCEADHLQYGRATATGTQLQASRRYNSAAADWSEFPVGTKFKIKGQPEIYVVDDYGRALVGTRTIDLYKPSRDDMNEWGARHVEIEILEMGCFKTSKEILKDRVHHAHCHEMYKSIPRGGFPLT